MSSADTQRVFAPIMGIIALDIYSTHEWARKLQVITDIVWSYIATPLILIFVASVFAFSVGHAMVLIPWQGIMGNSILKLATRIMAVVMSLFFSGIYVVVCLHTSFRWVEYRAYKRIKQHE